MQATEIALTTRVFVSGTCSRRARRTHMFMVGKLAYASSCVHLCAARRADRSLSATRRRDSCCGRSRSGFSMALLSRPERLFAFARLRAGTQVSTSGMIQVIGDFKTGPSLSSAFGT